ncbi:hypothetical protein [Chryseobacterium daecheongense]|uniref:Type II toxin-antitoxin system RelE/ParE family toxin n=1 Tax=Chryseobacterium daecheongense TaxID=192389 RepID=A0A3N0W6L6_9FLAO|nr:hypothetical protein [Chryseobacterium daecheongense]ROI00687.1 hypothetical protein EGI05_07370 [Chryseobacterium daecheongense]TDX94320.1 hypothetical protein BCF50_0084 [Chryseobacterium daecheongense]
MMKTLLSSIAENDIKLLIRVFNSDEKNKGKEFIGELKKCINEILEHHENHKPQEISFHKMQNFPVAIHYIFENGETLLIIAVFRKNGN